MLRVLGFASSIEIGTGFILILTPAILCRLLLGVEVSGDAALLARFFGIALLCLGLACWPGGDAMVARPAPVRAMLLYNAAIALVLAGLGLKNAGGILLWPAVALHLAIATLLMFRRSTGGGSRAMP